MWKILLDKIKKIKIIILIYSCLTKSYFVQIDYVQNLIRLQVKFLY